MAREAVTKVTLLRGAKTAVISSGGLQRGRIIYDSGNNDSGARLPDGATIQEPVGVDRGYLNLVRMNRFEGVLEYRPRPGAPVSVSMRRNDEGRYELLNANGEAFAKADAGGFDRDPKVLFRLLDGPLKGKELMTVYPGDVFAQVSAGTVAVPSEAHSNQAKALEGTGVSEDHLYGLSLGLQRAIAELEASSLIARAQEQRGESVHYGGHGDHGEVDLPRRKEGQPYRFGIGIGGWGYGGWGLGWPDIFFETEGTIPGTGDKGRK
jgi:hypothetical protein